MVMQVPRAPGGNGMRKSGAKARENSLEVANSKIFLQFFNKSVYHRFSESREQTFRKGIGDII